MDSPNSHSFQGTIETSEIETEILDDYPHEKIVSPIEFLIKNV